MIGPKVKNVKINVPSQAGGGMAAWQEREHAAALAIVQRQAISACQERDHALRELQAARQHIAARAFIFKIPQRS